MKYERLTKETVGSFGYDLKDFEHKPKEFNDCDAFYAYKTAVKSLGELEDKINPWIDAGRVVSFSIDVKLWIYVRYNSGLTMWYTKDSFDKEVCITFEAAEARLKELKEKSND